jgi:hypothetical protein
MTARRNFLPGLALAGLGVVFAPASAPAEPFETVLNNGSPQNRVDIVILGDGYTAAELQDYRDQVNVFLQYFFLEEPFREYQTYFNVHRIDVTSNESGVDHPEIPTFVDTALDGTYNCTGVQRLICVDNTKVNAIVAGTLAPSQHDLTLVVVNDTEYGGSGGAVAVTSINDSAIEIIQHEIGHTLGLLGDEYVGTPPPDCVSDVEPYEVNVTKQTVRALIKWGIWIDAGTPVPTTTTLPGVPGLYEGARYCANGLFRPTFNSRMRDIDLPFEQINSEQLIKRYYNVVSPLDSSLPADDFVTVVASQSLTFGASPQTPLTHALDVAWSVDGEARGSGTTFLLAGSSVSVGSHSVTVVVSDPTSQVRNDPDQLLRDQRTWIVDVVADSDGDGVPDDSDNCTLAANASQCDSDGDGFGNRCDGDLNNNNFTNAQDTTLFRAQLGKPSVAPTYNQADLNCNGFVNAQDTTLFRSRLGAPPGPAGPLP